MRFIRHSIVLLSLSLVVACDSQPQRSDPYLGNLDDTSYANRRDKFYPTAAGHDLVFDDFAGQFVWVDFAAPWCPPCGPQAKVIQRLEESVGSLGEVAFVTLMTSDASPTQAATNRTARAWARRHGLDPDHVAACSETRVIPSHMLFSPEGQLLYWSEGGLSAAQIRQVLERESRNWAESPGYTWSD